jgi:hypothetical protein
LAGKDAEKVKTAFEETADKLNVGGLKFFKV